MQSETKQSRERREEWRRVKRLPERDGWPCQAHRGLTARKQMRESVVCLRKGLAASGDHGTELMGCKTEHIPGYVLQNLGLIGEALTVLAVPQLVDGLLYLIALAEGHGNSIEAHSHGVVQTHGCCPPMAVTARSRG